MYTICSNNWTWTPLPVLSTYSKFPKSFICDQTNAKICYINDKVYECFHINNFSWTKFSSTSQAIDVQGTDPAFCLGGDGMYYSFAGTLGLNILQWNPELNIVTQVGKMPPSTLTNMGSPAICCVSVPGRVNEILVTLNPVSNPTYDFCLFNSVTNTWSTCQKCPSSYGADLTNRDCGVSGSNVILSPGGSPYSEKFTILNPFQAGAECQYIEGGDVIKSASYTSMSQVPRNFVPNISSQCQSP